MAVETYSGGRILDSIYIASLRSSRLSWYWNLDSNKIIAFAFNDSESTFFILKKLLNLEEKRYFYSI